MKVRFPSLLRGLLLAVAAALSPQTAQALNLVDASIDELQKSMAAGTLSSEALVQAYLDRVAAYDKQGPAINAVILLNAQALDVARQLDAERKAGHVRGPLHGIPIVLKDNFDTADLPTTAGSLLLKGSIPPDDAFVVKKLRAAGAVILAKVNLSEFASGAGGPNGFSSLGGQTLNPHDLTRGPAGSSGGTGAAIAAGFAQFGLGTDTGGSIRGPSSANGIVGLKPTRGLVSRDGIVPLALSFDTGGPMARSVADVAVALNVMAGADPADPATSIAPLQGSVDYTRALKRGSLRGARIGVARDFMGQNEDTDQVMEKAIATLRKLGATVIDPVMLPDYLIKAKGGIYQAINPPEFKSQIATYLGTLGPGYPRDLAGLIKKAEGMGEAYTNPWRLAAMRRAQSTAGVDDPLYHVARDQGLALVRSVVQSTFAKHRLDALVYPTSPRPARPIAPEPVAAAAGGGESATNIANETGYPDLIVPAGMTPDGLPVTISFFGPALSESKLLGYGYDYEQATHARVLPKNTPALPSDALAR